MLQEVEEIIARKQLGEQHNFVSDKSLHKLESLGNQLEKVPGKEDAEASNILVQYYVLKILDLSLSAKLIETEQKTTSSLIYLVNNVFLLHDVFVGTPLAKRMVARCKSLLQFISKRSKYYSN